jgi:urea transport system ATP-binding protein
MAIVLVEQYLDFASDLGDRFSVVDRGAIVYSSQRQDLNEGELKQALAL